MTTRICVHDSFDAARADWRRLEPDADCYVFQSYIWTRNWFERIGVHDGLQPCIATVAMSSGEPLLLLPLAVRKARLCTTLLLMGGRISDYHAPLLGKNWSAHAAAAEFPILWQRICAALPPHDVVALEKLPARIGNLANPLAGLACVAHPASAHYASLGESADTFVRSRRSARSLATDRRKARRLAERGQLEFEHAQGPERIASLLDTMMEQKSRSYAELGVTNLFDEPGCSDFVRHMTMQHPEMVALFALTLDGEPLATLWGLNFRGRYYHLLPSYARNEHTALSPGNVLLQRVFDWCVERGIDTYDFTVGDEGYKQHWCQHELKLFDINAAASIRGTPIVLARRARTRLKRAIKGSPRVFALARNVRRLLGSRRGD